MRQVTLITIPIHGLIYMTRRRTQNNYYEETFVDEDTELSYRVQYAVTPYYPETGPSYACAGEPASGREIEIDFIHPHVSPEMEKKIHTWLEENHDYSED